MAKTEEETKKKNKKQDDKNKNKDERKNKQDNKKGGKGEKKGKKKEEPEYKPGMPSWMYDPCPHRVWTPKPGERDKSEPRGAGSPWHEPVRKKEDIEKEEEEKNKKKEEKAAKKRQKNREEKEKKREAEEKKKKEEEEKNKEEEKKKEEKKKEKEKQKKKKEDEKRKKQKEEREKKKKEEEEKKEKEEEEKKKGGKEKKKEKKKEPPAASYFYDPCPHKVYTPGPGEKDLADPRGVGSPWYVPVKRKMDIEKEEEEREKEENEKRKERSKQHKKEQKEKEKKEEEKRRKAEAKQRKREQEMEERQEERRREREERKQEKLREEMEKYMGEGASESRTDFTPELMLVFDFISGVDEEEREKRGEALQMRKEEIEAEMESHLAKEAFTNDFKTLVSTFVEAEWGKADDKLKILKREERQRRRAIFKNMDPFAKDLMEEGKRFNSLYKGAMWIKESRNERSGHGKPSPMEDLLISRIMEQMDKLTPQPLTRSVLTF